MYLKYIRYYYIILTVYAIVTPLKLNFFDFLPAVLIMWLIYFLFEFSIRHNLQKHKIRNVAKFIVSTNDKFSKISLLIMLYAVIFVPLYIQFYTGTSLLVSIKSFLSFNSLGHESTYASYQSYFEEANLKQFTLSKVPYILGSGLLKFLYWAVFVRTLAYKKKATFVEYISVFVISILYVFSGMARGTSFENFEIIMLLVYTILLREKIIYNRNWFGQKSKYVIFILLVLGGFYFMLSKSLRGTGEILEVGRITNEMVYDPQSVVSLVNQKLSLVLHSFSGYFLFGMYFSSVSIYSIWFSSMKGFLSIFIPKGVLLLGIGESYNETICTKVIDCGAAWSPDVIKIVDSMGIILFAFMIVILAKLSVRLYKNLLNGSIISALLLYILVLFFFSLPVGNFVTASSSVIIAIVLCISVKNLAIFNSIHQYLKAQV